MIKMHVVPIFVGAVAFAMALACSSSDPSPPTGDASKASKGRILVSSETGSEIAVLDLEQGVLESNKMNVSKGPEFVVSPEGQYAMVVQASGNRVNFIKMGTSVAPSSSDGDAAADPHAGHNHKSRSSGDHGHDHGASESSDESESTSDSGSSVEMMEIAITGKNLTHVVARGQWIAMQFDDKVVVLAEDDLENKIDSINESIFYEIPESLPGVPIDEEHIAIGNKVFEIADGANLHWGINASANALMSSNILSATRSGEGTVLFGTDQGLLVVGKHTETVEVEWVDLMVPYPTLTDEQIFIVEDDHGHGEDDEDHGHGEGEHEEVEEHRAATEWATMDGLGHAFVHLTHESHSAGVYLVEAEGLESDGDLSAVFEYLSETSGPNVRLVAMSLVKLHEEHEGEEEEEDGEDHQDTVYLLLLMSDGSLRIHNAVEEGAYITKIDNVIAPMTDFHEGENSYPGMTVGFGKVFIGDPASNEVHQIDLKSFGLEQTWSLGTKPNRLQLMGESTLSEGSSHSHSHD